MAGQVCVDASLVLTLLLPHDLTPNVETLWQAWLRQNVEVVAPPLFFAEVTSVLRENVYFRRITSDEGEKSFADFVKLGIRSIDPAELQQRAWTMAKAHNRPRAYDAQYLAVAAEVGCDLWTADRRLVNAVGLPMVKWIGNA